MVKSDGFSDGGSRLSAAPNHAAEQLEFIGVFKGYRHGFVVGIAADEQKAVFGLADTLDIEFVFKDHGVDFAVGNF